MQKYEWFQTRLNKLFQGFSIDQTTIIQTVLQPGYLAESTCYFEACHGVFLGVLVGMTSFDQEEALRKITEIERPIDPDYALRSILIHVVEAEDDDDLLQALQKSALHMAIQDYLDWDEELGNPDYFELSIIQKIESAELPDDKFHKLVEQSMPARIEFWEEVFNETFTQDVRLRYNEGKLEANDII